MRRFIHLDCGLGDMRNLLFFFFTLSIGIDGFSCVNEYRTRLSGEIRYQEPLDGRVYTWHPDTTKLRMQANAYLKHYQETDSIIYLSNYGAKLIWLGEYELAKTIFLGIEKNYPNQYATASNLGTIYELLGVNDSALVWIRRGIALNPDSHQGSEWIHEKILNFKNSAEKDYSKSILGLDFGTEDLPKNKRGYDLKALEQSLEIQLRSRHYFIPDSNRIIGNLYFDLGNVYALNHDVETALGSFQVAKENGFTSPLMEKRIQVFEGMTGGTWPYEFMLEAKDLVKTNFWLFFSLGLVLIFGGMFVLYLIWKRLKERLQNQNIGS